MQSRKNKTSAQVKDVSLKHVAFFPLVVLVLIVWIAYRALFHFPIWFDEIIGKAIFFGLPVWLYLSLTKSRSMFQTFAPSRLQPGLLLGVLVGGIFGFAGTLATLLHAHVFIQEVPLFASNAFWWEFFLALMTGFWESLFFFSWIMVVVQEKFNKWSILNQVLVVAFIFLAFHIPNTILRFDPSIVVSELVLLFFFALGQALLFARSRNVYALMVSQAIWGMVLLIHSR